MSYGYIYLIKDHFTHKVYVGQKKGLPEKTQNYFGSGKIIRSIYNKRPHHLEKIILGVCNSKEELSIFEIICIEFFEAKNPIYGYNLTDGGCGTNGHHLSNDHKNKIIESNKRRIVSSETKRKIGEANSGKVRSKEFCEQRKQICTGRFYSEETRRKIGDAHKGMIHSEESKQQMSNNRKGKTSGKNNPMFGVSMIQRMINKYGEEFGKIKYEQWKQNKRKIFIGVEYNATQNSTKQKA